MTFVAENVDEKTASSRRKSKGSVQSITKITFMKKIRETFMIDDSDGTAVGDNGARTR